MSSRFGPPEQEEDEGDERAADHAEVGLDAAVLELREELAAARDGGAALVEGGVDDVGVEEVVEPGEGEDEIGDKLDEAVEDPAVKPGGGAGGEGVEAEEGGGVEGVDVPGVVEEREGVGFEAGERVGGVGGGDGLASVEEPAEAEAEEDDERGGEQEGQDAGGGEGG